MTTETETPLAEQAVAAMDAALEAEAPPPEPVAEPEPEAAPEPAVPEGEPPAGEPEPAADPDPSPEAKVDGEAIKAEMDSLGIKSPKSRERFEAMSAEIATFRPIKEMLEQAGIKDLAEVPHLISRAQAADTFEQALEQTNAPPEDFAVALDVLAKLNSGDASQAKQAFNTLQEVMKYWAPRLGIDNVAIDPLDEFPDLKEQVGFGEITRPAALELAKARAQAKSQEARAAQTNEVQQAQSERQSAAQALNQWDVAMQSHPQLAAKFKAVKPQLEAHLRLITDRVHPSEWLPMIQDLFNSLPAPAPVMAPPAARPMRPSGITAPPAIPQSDNPLDAMDLALAQLNGRR